MKAMIIVGARPNFMKAAPIITALGAARSGLHRLAFGAQEIDVVLVHTGQHYDAAMSDSFFADLGLPKPDVYLGVGSGSHAAQTAEIMRRFEEVVLAEKPGVVIVVGDVNSTVACALVAAKIAYDSNGSRPMIAHVEAGLRSFDRGMPEEINRIVTDHLSDMLFVTESSGVENLHREGVAGEKIHFVGNTMIDSLLSFESKADQSEILDSLGLREGGEMEMGRGGVPRYALLTLHRPSNVDERGTFLNILEGLEELSTSCPIMFSAHPRTRKRIEEFGLERFFVAGKDGAKGIRLLEPLRYLDFVCLMKHAAIVVTDSGGIQEETTCLGVPCVTVRENTERPVTITEGTNRLAGTKRERIREVVREQEGRAGAGRIPEKWDGKAAERIVGAILEELEKKKTEIAAL
ncbi:MAG TPA: UDP-N-acetylglucosamine 2-epimerase (non-hydrolyzing) [Candidatus Acidoferrum sp.]|nr:UDP-N-acetylglucosamine 2-epimerase (non-hydrolyzing) [Candidatus Acidoferrum sp.]